MRVVWCNRYGQRPEWLPGTPDREITFDRRVRTGMNPKIAIMRLAQTMISYLR